MTVNRARNPVAVRVVKISFALEGKQTLLPTIIDHQMIFPT